MNNIKIIDSNENGVPPLKTVKLVEANLWMEPSTKRADTDFWIERFKSQRVPFILAQYDTEMLNAQNEKMYRRVYGIFIDMKTWEKKNDEHKTSES